MQRFFSTFPNGPPGAGLLLLRLALAGVLFADAVATVSGLALSQSILAAAQILAGIFLVIGLWTPIAGALACLLQLGMLLAADQMLEPRLLRAMVGVSLALLGPGAWSIDARLFGRRRVDIRQLREE